jgi:hypothetical protein
MTTDDLLKEYDEFVAKQRDILDKKNRDYAGNDATHAFRSVAKVAGVSPEQVCLVMIATKATRIGTLLNATTINNESLEDSIDDLFNYAALLHIVRHENNKV